MAVKKASPVRNVRRAGRNCGPAGTQYIRARPESAILFFPRPATQNPACFGRKQGGADGGDPLSTRALSRPHSLRRGKESPRTGKDEKTLTLHFFFMPEEGIHFVRSEAFLHIPWWPFVKDFWGEIEHLITLGLSFCLPSSIYSHPWTRGK